ncbi:MAG TPA: hypothetical protein VMU61_02295 [Candidatus Aquilonibacter sp.]|nr:hypothetical protein [Candidatus Aquilonibacter sp.]
MNVEIYSEWLRRQGQTVLRSPSSYWHSAGFGVCQAFPYHWLIQPPAEELRELMAGARVAALRYSLPAGGPGGNPSYHVIYQADDYGLESLRSWARKNVRRGLRQCEVTPISFARYVEEGWELRLDTLARQGRRVQESQRDWRRRYLAAAELPGFEVWGAMVQGRLAATLVVFQLDNWFYLLYQQCHSGYLREHVNNALSFTVTRNLVGRPATRGVFYGMQSLDAPSSVDEFKLRMGYEARPVRQSVAFHPVLALLANRFSQQALRAAKGLRPGSRWLAKTEGLLRLHLAEKHHTPEPLNPRYDCATK